MSGAPVPASLCISAEWPITRAGSCEWGTNPHLTVMAKLRRRLIQEMEIWQVPVMSGLDLWAGPVVTSAKKAGVLRTCYDKSETDDFRIE